MIGKALGRGPILTLLFVVVSTATLLTADLENALAIDDHCSTTADSEGHFALGLAQLRAVQLSKQHKSRAAHRQKLRKSRSHHRSKKTRSRSRPSHRSKGRQSTRQGRELRLADTVGFVEKTLPGSAEDYGHPKWLQKCRRILLDLGSHQGANIRRLLEPERHTGSSLINVLASAFGSEHNRRDSGDICALGLEPNPAHAEKLQRLAASYAGNSIHVHFYPFAAWREDGRVGLNLTSKDNLDVAEVGAHLNMMGNGHKGKEVKVQTIDLASFILSLPEQSVELLIIDIEGSEYETMAWLLMQGVLCDKYVRRILVRANDHGETTHWGQEGAFKHGTHPRSFTAMQEKLDLLRDYGWCKPDALPALMQLKSDSD